MKYSTDEALEAARVTVRRHAPMAKQITREAFKAAGMVLGALVSAAATSSSNSVKATWDGNDQDECYYSDYSGFHYSGGYKPDHD